MKMKYLIAVLIMLAGLCACHDDDDTQVIPGQRPAHAMRVKKISGYNEYWKEYTLEVTYANNKVVDIQRFSKTGRQMGGLGIQRSQGKVTYRLKDYVPAVDADSVARLDARLKGLYGAGNYTLEDSIPLTSTDLMILTVGTEEGVVISQQFTYYQPKSDFGTGGNFSPRYSIRNRESYVFEYGEGASIVTCRSLVDIYDPEDSQSYTRSGYKSEYGFSGQQLKECAVYEAGDQYEGNWKRLRNLIYTYSGQDLVSISGDGYSLQRNYTGGKLVSVVENGVTTSYTMNEQNFCTQVEDANGRVMHIEYEAGDGDFEIFNRLDMRQRGMPVIL